MENGELRSGKALCGRPTAAPTVTQVQMGYKWCAEVAPYGIIRYQTKPADAVHDHRANELRDTGMSRLRRAADMCSSTESGTAQR